MQTVSLTVFRFAAAADRLWAFSRMGLGRRELARTEEIGFWKLCGSGTGEGFTPRPNTAVYAILATWPDLATARAQTVGAPAWRRYAARAQERWSVYLSPSSVRGRWSGQTPFEICQPLGDGPVAALTRATIRPNKALQFWAHEPAISAAIGRDPNVLFKIGIGELPFLFQVTFSVWPDTDSMDDFARRDGPHARAIQAVRDGDWFREELYARFRVLGAEGSWGGADPLAGLRNERQVA